jgi:hypothetical protein
MTRPPSAYITKKVLVVQKDGDGNLVGEYWCPKCGNEVPLLSIRGQEFFPCGGYYIRIVVQAEYVINEQVLA